MERRGLLGVVVVVLVILIVVTLVLYFVFLQDDASEVEEQGENVLSVAEVGVAEGERGTCNNDGVVDSGEECDDGNFVNLDDCLNDCRRAVCGDGYVHSFGNGSEECDESFKNSDGAADSCRTDCTLARCGDGVIDSSEECDEGNFADYLDGVEQCSNYSLKYGSGSLGCVDCRVEISECVDVVRALGFDGVDDSMDISSVELDETKEFTFSFWVRPVKKHSDARSILGCTNSWISLKVVNSDYVFSVITDSNSTEKEVRASSARVGLWGHVVAVHSKTHAKIYFDGSLVDSKAQSGELFDDVTCRVGANREGDLRFFDGALDDVRVYERVLLSGEIFSLYESGQNFEESGEGLIGWWAFDSSGGVAEDSSGNGWTGGLVGAPERIVEEI